MDRWLMIICNSPLHTPIERTNERVQAVPLITSPEEYPYWKTSKPLVVPRGIPQVRIHL